MAISKRVVATAGDLVRRFSRYSDIALTQPVLVTKNGRPRNVLISAVEYERLKKRDRIAFFASDTPEEFLPALRALARTKKR